MRSAIGVLALQGGYAAHEKALADLGHTHREVRTPEDLDGLTGLILPGGESTTHLKLIDRFGLWGPLDTFARSGKPVFCTCAGLILAARTVTHPAQHSFGWLDVAVARNAWGRQVHSFEDRADQPLPDPTQHDKSSIPLMFIRAPRIEQVGRAEVILTLRGEPILVRQGNVWGASFHPELTHDRRLHRAIFGGPG